MLNLLECINLLTKLKNLSQVFKWNCISPFIFHGSQMGSVFCFCSVLYFVSVALGGLYVVCCCTFEDCEDGALWHKPDFVFWSFISMVLIKTNLIHHCNLDVNALIITSASV
jgi:hypothetical protein